MGAGSMTSVFIRPVRATFLLAASLSAFAFSASAGVDSNSAVFIILMENHNWSSIKGSASAPYINNVLLPMASHAEQYYNPPGLHPSLPNYLWLEAGQNFGIYDDNDPSANHQSTTNHLAAQLKNAGISWRAYEEDITGTTCPLTNYNGYAVRHNPFVYFDDMTGANNANSPYCIANVRPYSQLAADLAGNTVARYNFITPNVCDDMHDSCLPLTNSIRQGDNWLSNNIPMILSSQAYNNGGVVFITWDEGENGSDGPIGMIVLSPYAKGSGYSNTVHYTHSSTLRTMQKNFGVRPLLNNPANASDLSDLFLPGTIPNGDPFALDGVADSTNFLQNAGPMVIYAAVRGTILYVATWSPGSNTNGVNDHFVIVTDQLSPTLQSAFPTWSKTGMNAVDPSKPFLSGESVNTYVGWQNTTAANLAYKAPTNSGLLEGTLDLVQAFGPNIMTGAVYIAAAAYSTTNGGALVAQGPPGNGDRNIDSNEFLTVPIPALLDNNFDGIYDRLDPKIGFMVLSTQSLSNGNLVVSWAAEPRRNYQVQFADALASPTAWQDLPGGQTNAGQGQLTLSLTDSSVPGATNRFYRVRLLNP
jgi:phosphatidylinositol-3-phosphatase